ncbi:hypothetical protein BDR26DRAFT_444405 [Obelidium mucronatum]|nr:hypothetical protein BDR26DRAFT_444405 [Obelidium mucronatum]
MMCSESDFESNSKFPTQSQILVTVAYAMLLSSAASINRSFKLQLYSVSPLFLLIAVLLSSVDINFNPADWIKFRSESTQLEAHST